MLTVDGTEIPLYSTMTMAIWLGGMDHCHMFLVSDVERPILGWDFMRTHKATLQTSPVRDFFVLTDYKPLVAALHRVDEPWSP